MPEEFKMNGAIQDRQALEQKLLAAVREAEKELRSCDATEKDAAQRKYHQALKRFNDFVIHRRAPDF